MERKLNLMAEFLDGFKGAGASGAVSFTVLGEAE